MKVWMKGRFFVFFKFWGVWYECEYLCVVYVVEGYVMLVVDISFRIEGIVFFFLNFWVRLLIFFLFFEFMVYVELGDDRGFFFVFMCLWTVEIEKRKYMWMKLNGRMFNCLFLCWKWWFILWWEEILMLENEVIF